MTARSLARLAAGALLVLSLSGCFGATNGTGPPPLSVPIADPEAQGVHNAIEGQVYAHEGGALAASIVTLVDLDLVRVTDAEGRYRFLDLPEGHYEVRATMLGYRDATASAVVREGLATSIDFILHNVGLDEPYHDAYPPFWGYVACQATAGTPAGTTTQDCGIVDGSNDPDLDFPVDPGVVQVQAQAHWVPTTAASRVLTLRVEWIQEDGSVQTLLTVEGLPDLKAIVEADALKPLVEEGGQLRATLGIGPGLLAGTGSPVAAGLALEQRFQLDVAVFYLKPGPADFAWG